MDLQNKNIIILGAGESGIGAALLAQRHNARVFVSDYGDIKEGFASELKKANIEFESGGHSLEKILGADVIIKSPGISEATPVMQAVRNQNIDVWSEIEFAAHFTDGRIIGITGSNGKTTTTLLIHHILATAGFDAQVVGNTGYSFARALLENERSHYVVELSSFQLDDVHTFNPDIAVVLNITPDHLDRYNMDVKQYGRAKMRIAQNQTANNVFIYNSSDALINELLGEGAPKARMVKIPMDETSNEVRYGSYHFKSEDITLKGKHNQFNASCAVAAAVELGIQEEKIAHALATFKNEAHRLEYVCSCSGVEFINDSKATNVDSVWFALDAMEQPVVWIAGGTDKGNDYSALNELVEKKVKALICLGLDNKKLMAAFKERVSTIKETQDMTVAVKDAHELSGGKAAVLLSPACASFDLFDNYIDRGNQFKEAAKTLCAQL